MPSRANCEWCNREHVLGCLGAYPFHSQRPVDSALHVRARGRCGKTCFQEPLKYQRHPDLERIVGTVHSLDLYARHAMLKGQCAIVLGRMHLIA